MTDSSEQPPPPFEPSKSYFTNDDRWRRVDESTEFEETLTPSHVIVYTFRGYTTAGTPDDPKFGVLTSELKFSFDHCFRGWLENNPKTPVTHDVCDDILTGLFTRNMDVYPKTVDVRTATGFPVCEWPLRLLSKGAGPTTYTIRFQSTRGDATLLLRAEHPPYRG